MNSLKLSKTSRLLPVGLVVLMIAGLIFAPTAQAIRYIYGGDGPDGGSGEGDPLDANDFDGGGFGGDDVEDGAGFVPPSAGGIIFQRPVADGRVFFILDFQGVIPVLRVIKVDDAVVLLGDPYAR